MEAVFPSSGRSPGGSGDSRSLEVASVEIAGLGEGWNLSTRGLGNRDTGFCVWSLVGRMGRMGGVGCDTVLYVQVVVPKSGVQVNETKLNN